MRGRRLDVIHLAGGAPGPGVLVFGGIHGDEPLGPALVELLALSLLDGGVPGWERPRRDAWLVPAVNPDGLALATKDNARGVDLNRNFPAKNWSPAHPPGYFPGSHPASEPETAALVALIDELRPGRLCALHEPLRCVNYDGPAEAIARRMSDACGYPVQADLGYPTPGSAGSLYGVDRGLEIVTLELPRVGLHDAWKQCGPALRVLLEPGT